jgi:hypothetical protein
MIEKKAFKDIYVDETSDFEELGVVSINCSNNSKSQASWSSYLVEFHLLFVGGYILSHRYDLIYPRNDE